ncbi:MAG: alpha-rhamnosidase, partial [Bacteroidales bacterium]|nr:alpha-rhamnosidase [Bacteroidales bacterium]
EKWLADHKDAQQPNGLLPNIIPTSGWGLDWATGPDWTGSVAIIPWAIYEFYGDSRLLRTMYDNIRRYVNWLDASYPSGICSQGLGDWITVKTHTPQTYTTTVYYYRVTAILAKAAKLFERQEDYEKYSALAEKIRNAFNDKYLNRETAVYLDGNQTEMSTALLWGLVPDELRQKVADNLAKRVIADNSHLDCGMLGTKAIFNALGDNGYADLACTVLSQETWPGFGYWIVKDNATTLYEDWYSIGERKESSLNHIMFGEFSAWLYRIPGGIRIDPEHPGFAKFLLRPQFITSLNNVNVEYDSPRGKIISHWTRPKKNTVNYKVTVPANSAATLILPDGYKLKKATLSSGDKVDLTTTSESGYELPAGSYEFTVIK